MILPIYIERVIRGFNEGQQMPIVSKDPGHVTWVTSAVQRILIDNVSIVYYINHKRIIKVILPCSDTKAAYLDVSISRVIFSKKDDSKRVSLLNSRLISQIPLNKPSIREISI